MATKDELYMSVDLSQYKRNKANLLSSQIDLINSIKRFSVLKNLVEQEKNLKIRLQELFSSITKDFEKLEESVPTPNLPKSLKEKSLPKRITIEIGEPIIEEEPSKIDEELMEIQEKLNQLNS